MVWGCKRPYIYNLWTDLSRSLWVVGCLSFEGFSCHSTSHSRMYMHVIQWNWPLTLKYSRGTELGAPHTYSFTFSFSCTVNNCAVRSTVWWKFRTFVQLKFLDCVTFGKAEDLTAQCTLDCSVCCVLKAEAQFVYIFNAVNITEHGYLVEGFSSRVYWTLSTRRMLMESKIERLL